MRYEIEKGIPIPEKPMDRESKYPLTKMEVGDSFFVPPGYIGESVKSTRRSILSSARRHKPKAFIAIKEGGGIRVWRVK